MADLSSPPLTRSRARAPARSRISRRDTQIIESASPPHSTQEQREHAVQAPNKAYVENLQTPFQREISVAAHEQRSTMHKYWHHWSKAMGDILEEAFEGGLEYWLLIAFGLILSVGLVTLAINLLIYFELGSEDLRDRGVMHFMAQYLPDAILAAVAAIPAYLISVYADQQRKMSFSRLEFYKCINFSLNFFEHRHGEPVLTFTTLMEQTLAAMTYNNPLVIKYVMDEAAKTTEENCLMFSEPDKPKEVQKQLYTPIIKAAQNAMACQFSEGAVDHIAGLPTATVELVFAFTCERGRLVPQTKIRVMLCEPIVLEQIHQYVQVHGAAARPPRFLSPTHAPRWQTLQQMAAVYINNKRLLTKVRLYRVKGSPTLALTRHRFEEE